jgi:hypothetical protein
VGVDVVQRLLIARDAKRTTQGNHDVNDKEDGNIAQPARGNLDFSGFPSKTANALTTLVDVIVRDYIKWVLPGQCVNSDHI